MKPERKLVAEQCRRLKSCARMFYPQDAHGEADVFAALMRCRDDAQVISVVNTFLTEVQECYNIVAELTALRRSEDERVQLGAWTPPWKQENVCQTCSGTGWIIVVRPKGEGAEPCPHCRPNSGAGTPHAA